MTFLALTLASALAAAPCPDGDAAAHPGPAWLACRVACLKDSDCRAFEGPCGEWKFGNKKYASELERYWDSIQAEVRCMAYEPSRPPKAVCVKKVCAARAAAGKIRPSPAK